eukprot:Polyplicarium_translucidae@DN2916_c1_g1_i4.p1
MKYIGWGLSDRCVEVRLNSSEFIRECLEDESRLAVLAPSDGVPAFVQFFTRAMLDSIRDVNATVRANGVRAVTALVERLEDNDVEEVIQWIWVSTDIDVLEALATFVDRAIFTSSVLRDEEDEPREETDSSDRRDLSSIGEFVVEFGKECMRLTGNVVKAFWRRTPAFRNISVLLDMLTLQEIEMGGREGISSDAHEVLMHVLLAVVKSIKTDFADAKAGRIADRCLAARSEELVYKAVPLTFNRLPALLTRNKESEEASKVTACIAFELGTLLHLVRSSLLVQPTFSALRDGLRHHNDRECLSALAAATAATKEALEGDTLHLSMSAVITAFTSALSNALDECLAGGLDVTAIAAHAAAQRKVLAIVKAARRYSPDWESLASRTCSLLHRVGKVRDGEETARDGMELVFIVYLQLWADIHDIGRGLEARATPSATECHTVTVGPSGSESDELAGDGDGSECQLTRKRLREGGLALPSRPAGRKRRTLSAADVELQTSVKADLKNLREYLTAATTLRATLWDTAARLAAEIEMPLGIRVAAAGMLIQSLSLNLVSQYFSQCPIESAPIFDAEDLEVVRAIKSDLAAFGLTKLGTSREAVIKELVTCLIQQAEEVDAWKVPYAAASAFDTACASLSDPIAQSCPFFNEHTLFATPVETDTIATPEAQAAAATNVTDRQAVSFARMLCGWIASAASFEVYGCRIGVRVVSLLGRTSRPELDDTAASIIERLKRERDADALWDVVGRSLRSIVAWDGESSVSGFCGAVFKAIGVANSKTQQKHFLALLCDVLEIATDTRAESRIGVLAAVVRGVPRQLRAVFDAEGENHLRNTAIGLVERRRLGQSREACIAVKEFVDRFCRTKLSLEIPAVPAPSSPPPRVVCRSPGRRGPPSPPSASKSSGEPISVISSDDETPAVPTASHAVVSQSFNPQTFLTPSSFQGREASDDETSDLSSVHLDSTEIMEDDE